MTPTTGPPVAVLDANVLYPQWLRDVMLTLAAEGSFQPAWSRQIIDEMRRNVLRNHPQGPDRFPWCQEPLHRFYSVHRWRRTNMIDTTGISTLVVSAAALAGVGWIVRRRPDWLRMLARAGRRTVERWRLRSGDAPAAPLWRLQQRIWEDWVLSAERTWEGKILLPHSVTVRAASDDATRLRGHREHVERELSTRARRHAERSDWLFDGYLDLQVEESVLALQGLPEVVRSYFRAGHEQSDNTRVRTQRAVELHWDGTTLFVFGRMTLGRDPSCDLVVDDPGVSRTHAQLEVSERGLEVQDLGSTNGTFANGRHLDQQPATVVAGDYIRFGQDPTFTVRGQRPVENRTKRLHPNELSGATRKLRATGASPPGVAT